mgnify:CR=1 FL=1
MPSTRKRTREVAQDRTFVSSSCCIVCTFLLLYLLLSCSYSRDDRVACPAPGVIFPLTLLCCFSFWPRFEHGFRFQTWKPVSLQRRRLPLLFPSLQPMMVTPTTLPIVLFVGALPQERRRNAHPPLHPLCHLLVERPRLQRERLCRRIVPSRLAGLLRGRRRRGRRCHPPERRPATRGSHWKVYFQCKGLGLRRRDWIPFGRATRTVMPRMKFRWRIRARLRQVGDALPRGAGLARGLCPDRARPFQVDVDRVERRDPRRAGLDRRRQAGWRATPRAGPGLRQAADGRHPPRQPLQFCLARDGARICRDRRDFPPQAAQGGGRPRPPAAADNRAAVGPTRTAAAGLTCPPTSVRSLEHWRHRRRQ